MGMCAIWKPHGCMTPAVRCATCLPGTLRSHLALCLQKEPVLDLLVLVGVREELIACEQFAPASNRWRVSDRREATYMKTPKVNICSPPMHVCQHRLAGAGQLGTEENDGMNSSRRICARKPPVPPQIDVQCTPVRMSLKMSMLDSLHNHDRSMHCYISAELNCAAPACMTPVSWKGKSHSRSAF